MKLMKFIDWRWGIYIVISLTLIVYLYTKNRLCQEESNRLSSLLENRDALLSRIIGNLEVQDRNNCVTLPSDLQLLTMDNERMSLKDIVAGGNRIVLFIPKNACNACFNRSMDGIKNFFSVFQNRAKSIAVFTDARRMRETISLFAQIGLEPRIYGVEGGFSMNKVSDILPFFFNIDPTLTCKNFFILDNGDPELIQVYLRILHDDFI